MRHIASLEEEAMPDGDKYRFRKRAADLVARWHKVSREDLYMFTLLHPSWHCSDEMQFIDASRLTDPRH